ncbi:MAG: alpha/beta fold hydrolase [Anaerolineales bacterium]|nr:alpha/beta fold hydrolase [Anaerolineales bacterium]MCZ2287251.1 alpha/beta hydrolase [Anaerolineales bacterium]
MIKFSRDNLSLAFERFGHGAPLMLIHGFPLDHTIWDEIVPLLKDDFDLILPDLRGFGQSDAADADYAMRDLADDLAALLDHLGLESAFLAGHSMGGYVALAFASAYPRRVRGLALVASQAAADAPERRQGRYAQAWNIAENGIGDTVAAMTENLTPDPRVRKFVHDLMRRQKTSAYIGSLKAMAERADTMQALEESAFPLLLVHGDADGLIPVERAREIQARVPRARLVELPGCGHMPMMESPRAAADAFLGWIT